MNRFIEVNAIDVITVPFTKWEKDRDQYLMATNGRWGPRWLHRLVFRAAKNLGMISYHRSSMDGYNVHRHVIDTMDKDVKTLIADMIEPFLRRGADVSDLVCVVGAEKHKMLARDIAYSVGPIHYSEDMTHLHPQFPPGSRSVYTRVFDVDVVLSPFMRGAIVLDRRSLGVPR